MTFSDPIGSLFHASTPSDWPPLSATANKSIQPYHWLHLVLKISGPKIGLTFTKICLWQFWSILFKFFIGFRSSWPPFSLFLNLFDPSFLQNLRFYWVHLFILWWTPYWKFSEMSLLPLCVYVCMCVYVCVCVYMCVYVCMCVCVCVCVPIELATWLCGLMHWSQGSGDTDSTLYTTGFKSTHIYNHFQRLIFTSSTSYLSSKELHFQVKLYWQCFFWETNTLFFIDFLFGGQQVFLSGLHAIQAYYRIQNIFYEFIKETVRDAQLPGLSKLMQHCSEFVCGYHRVSVKAWNYTSCISSWFNREIILIESCTNFSYQC